MRVLLQRVTSADVRVLGETVGNIQGGMLIFLGIGTSDTTGEADWLAEKIAGLRIFPDETGRMNRSLLDIGGEALVVSQFTLYADCTEGRRPNFTQAAAPELAEKLVEYFTARMKRLGVVKIASGVFGASMEVSLLNQGPVTLWLEREAPAR